MKQQTHARTHTTHALNTLTHNTRRGGELQDQLQQHETRQGASLWNGGGVGMEEEIQRLEVRVVWVFVCAHVVLRRGASLWNGGGVGMEEEIQQLEVRILRVFLCACVCEGEEAAG